MKNLAKIFLAINLFIIITSTSIYSDFTSSNYTSSTSTKPVSSNVQERCRHANGASNISTSSTEKSNTSESSLKDDEYIAYITKEAFTQPIKTYFETINPLVMVEMKVIQKKDTGKIVKVESLGVPFLYLQNDNYQWNGGNFNINKVNDNTYRLSTTGTISKANPTSFNQIFTIGFDILQFNDIPLRSNTNNKTNVITLVAYLKT
ncbi:MAG: hypothetical protein ACRDA4_02070 [Filifactoraceae bacterium]